MTLKVIGRISITKKITRNATTNGPIGVGGSRNRCRRQSTFVQRGSESCYDRVRLAIVHELVQRRLPDEQPLHAARIAGRGGDRGLFGRGRLAIFGRQRGERVGVDRLHRRDPCVDRGVGLIEPRGQRVDHLLCRGPASLQAVRGGTVAPHPRTGHRCAVRQRAGERQAVTLGGGRGLQHLEVLARVRELLGDRRRLGAQAYDVRIGRTG